MTAPAPSPEIVKRSKRIYVLWAIALMLLISTALFCWLVVVPVWEVDSVVGERPASFKEIFADPDAFVDTRIERLGGPGAAHRKIRLYLRMPGFSANHKMMAAFYLSRCGEAGLRDIFRLIVEHDEPLVRVGAMTALADHLDHPKANDAFTKALHDEAYQVRICAANAFQDITRPSRRAVKRLEELESDEHPKVRQAATDALKKIKAEQEKK